MLSIVIGGLNSKGVFLLKVLFVCTGNTCRSPMAEALAREKIGGEWKDQIEFGSAGTLDLQGSEASPLAVEVLADMGIDLTGHRSTHLTKELISSSDLVVAMAARHRDVILMIDPESEEKVILLGELAPGRENPDVSDPIGGDRERYMEVREDLNNLTDLLIDYMAERFGAEG